MSNINIARYTNFPGGFKAPGQQHQPIVGGYENKYTANIDINQAEVSVAGLICGAPVTVTNTPATTNNVFTITGASTALDNVNAFILRSTSFYLMPFGQTIPLPYPGSIVSIAFIGSGVETYLPVNAADFTGVSTSVALGWDFANKELVTATVANTLPGVKLLGSPEDGTGMTIDANGIGKYNPIKLIKVRL